MPGNIVVIGSSNTDMIVQVSRIPRPGETILGGEFCTAAGGKGANQAVAAARAGGQVTLVARVGQDMFGQQAVQGFLKDHINVDHVLRDATAPSGVALIFVEPSGENSIAVASGANAQLSPQDVTHAGSVIRAADMVVMQLETPLETVSAAAGIARSAQVRVILNPAPAQPLNDELLRNVTILTPNESEAELLTGIRVDETSGVEEAAEALLAKGLEIVMLTLGARGVFVATTEMREWVPGFQVDPVDTTAAGDVFNGALAVALAENRPLLEAARFANAAAALSVTRLGAQPSAPQRNPIEAMLTS
ncbi:MAG: ribokinase [Pirellulaceae bacterium]